MLPDNAAVVRRPGDVQMQPGTSRREFFQEQARRDRAAAVLAGVADIGIVALDQLLVFRVVWDPPEALAGALRRAQQAVVEALSFAITPVVTYPSIAQIAPVSVAISTRCVQPSRFCGPRKAVGKDQPPLRIEFRISIVLPEKLVMTSPGTMLESEIRFSQTGTTTVTLTGTPFAASARSAAAAAAPPAISPLIPPWTKRLHAVAACIHRHALTDKTEPPAAVRCAGIAQHDHRRGVCTAVANGQKSPQAEPLQRLPVIELCLNWQTIRHVLQLLRQHLGSEQIRRAVHQIARFHDRPRQLPCLLHLLAASAPGKLHASSGSQRPSSRREQPFLSEFCCCTQVKCAGRSPVPALS